MHAKYFSTVWWETRKYIVFELFSIAYMCKRITKCSHSVSIVFYTVSKCFGTLPLTASHIKRESLRSVSLTARHVLSWWTLRAANSRGKNKLEENSTSHRARVKIAYNDSDKKKNTQQSVNVNYIWRAGQRENVSGFCCQVTAALAAHLTSHKPSLGLFFHRFNKQTSPSRLSEPGNCAVETELEVDVRGGVRVPGTGGCCSCCLISTALMSEHGNSFDLTLVILGGSGEQRCSTPPGRKAISREGTEFQIIIQGRILHAVSHFFIECSSLSVINQFHSCLLLLCLY